MATLKIYNDIQTEEEKIWYSWGGMEGVCYKDIDTFCDSIPKDDDKIDIRLFCNGGSVQEGWAMYDRLRATGKEISCTIEGKAASMATVILMAAPKERRYAYPNSSVCVHNPWVDPWYLGDSATADDLRKMADDLQREQDKILDLYVERCGCDRAEMQALMDEDKYIDTDRALELGIIGEVLSPISAKGKEGILFNHHNQKKMAKKDEEKTIEVKQSFVDRLLGFFGKKSIAEITFGMDLNTADGTTLTIDREEGEPQVGDGASPDGEWLMPDGKTIVVEDGVITEIRTEDGEGDNTDEQTEGEDGEQAELKEQLEAMTAERDALKEQLEAALANAKTKEDMVILNAVKMAGGKKALARLQSHYKPEGRKPEGKQAADKANGREEGKQAILALLRERKEKKK